MQYESGLFLSYPPFENLPVGTRPSRLNWAVFICGNRKPIDEILEGLPSDGIRDLSVYIVIICSIINAITLETPVLAGGMPQAEPKYQQ